MSVESDPSVEMHGSLVETIGNTPVLELTGVVDDTVGRVLAKLEYRNPTGSKEDRVARALLDDARAGGHLARCQSIVAGVDGPLALSLAQLCATLRHPLNVVMLRGTGEAQVDALRRFGVEIDWVDPEPTSDPGQPTTSDLERLQETVDRIARVTGSFDPAPMHNPSAFRAHRLWTGPEYARQLQGAASAFVDFCRTGATLGGCAAAFRELDNSIRCFAAEPTGARVLAGEPVVELNHGIIGGGLGLEELPLLSGDVLAGHVGITFEEAKSAMEDLARKEGIMTGLRSGANLAAARKLLEGPCFGDTIAIVIHDAGGLDASAEMRRREIGGGWENLAA